jgi:hypothetical protein
MKKFLSSSFLSFFLLVACEAKSPAPQGKPEAPVVPTVIVEKDSAGREEPPPLEVKIKLRRDGKDNYSWEISGSDVNQILKVDEKLRKQLGGEKSR